MTKVIPGGVVHKVPPDWRALLTANDELRAVWETCCWPGCEHR